MMSIEEYTSIIGIDKEDFISNSRKENICFPRHAYWYYLKNHEGIKYKRIAKLFCRTHASVINGVKSIQNMIDTKNKSINQYLEVLGIFSHQ